MASLGAAAGLRPGFAAERVSFLVNRHPQSSEAGMKVLRAGGNAVDAAVAAALVAAVTSPNNCGIGGYGGHMMIALAKTRRTVAIDFNSTAPAAMTPEAVAHRGWASAGVSGTLAGLQLAAERYGTKSLRELLAPAIEFAAQGFAVGESLANTIRAMTAALQKDAPSAALFFKDGRPLQAGEIYRNPDLARMLQKLANENSVEDFYRGEIGRQIAAESGSHGGLVTSQDMAAYRAREVEPLRFRWKECLVTTAPLTAGGITVLQALGILKALGWEKSGEPMAKVEALRHAWEWRLRTLGDPEKSRVPVERLLSAELAEELAAKVRIAVRDRRPADLNAIAREQGGTIHLNSVDAEGNAVALTLTHGESFGACVTVSGLGLTLGHGISRFERAANHPNSAGPGKRPLHNMCPTIVFRDDGEMLSLGGAGGRAIPSAVFSVLTAYIGGGSLEESVAAPRCATQGTLNVTLDRQWAEKDVEAFKSAGYAVKSGAVANVCAIARDAKTGECRGAAR